MSQESDYVKKAGLYRHLFHCLCPLYFKSLLTNPSGDTAESPESALPVIQVLDVTGGHRCRWHTRWFNQEEAKLSLWKHNTLTGRFLIWTSGIYKLPEIISKTVHTCEYAYCSGENPQLSSDSPKVLFLDDVKLMYPKEKFSNSLTKKLKER